MVVVSFHLQIGHLLNSCGLFVIRYRNIQFKQEALLIAWGRALSSIQIEWLFMNSMQLCPLEGHTLCVPFFIVLGQSKLKFR